MPAVGDWIQEFVGILLRVFTPTGTPRGEVRQDIKAAVTVRSDGFAVDCMTINVSSSGLLVDRALDARPGMRVRLATSGGGPDGIPGRIVRVGANSTAIRIDGRQGSAFIGSLRARRPEPVMTESISGRP